MYALAIPQAYRDAAAELLPPGPAYGGLVPGAGGKHKCWPLENYLAVARDMSGAGLVPVFLLGPDESEWYQGLRQNVPGALFPEQEGTARALPGGPLLTLALAQHLAVSVSNDSGAGHILAAARRPLVSLFGPTSPDRFTEAAENRVILRAQQFGGPELHRIGTDQVMGAVRTLLRQARLRVESDHE